MRIRPDDDGSYRSSASTDEMKLACQLTAVWKLCQNGPAITKFACRGGANGSRNVRKTFGAELADPYADSDSSVLDPVDAVLRIVASGMIRAANHSPNTIPGPEYSSLLLRSV